MHPSAAAQNTESIYFLSINIDMFLNQKKKKKKKGISIDMQNCELELPATLAESLRQQQE